MFNIDAKPTFKRRVEFVMTDEQTGQPMSLDVTFRALTTKESEPFDLTTGEGSKAFLRAAVVSMDGLVAAGNAPVTYNDTLRDRLLEQAWVRAGLAEAYFKAVVGLREGNSDGLPAAGPVAAEQPASATMTH